MLLLSCIVPYIRQIVPTCFQTLCFRLAAIAECGVWGNSGVEILLAASAAQMGYHAG